MIGQIAAGILIAFVVIAFWRFVWRLAMLGILIGALIFGGFLVYEEAEAEALPVEHKDPDPPTAGAAMRERIEREIVRSCMEHNSTSSDIGRCLEFRGVNPYLQYVYAN